MSFAYSWYVAIITGGIVEIVLFLVGTLSMETEISLSGALLGCILDTGVDHSTVLQDGC